MEKLRAQAQYERTVHSFGIFHSVAWMTLNSLLEETRGFDAIEFF